MAEKTYWYAKLFARPAKRLSTTAVYNIDRNRLYHPGTVSLCARVMRRRALDSAFEVHAKQLDFERLSKARCQQSDLGEYDQFVTSRRSPKAFAVPLSGFCGLGCSLEPMPIGVLAEFVPVGLRKVYAVMLRGLFNVGKR